MKEKIDDRIWNEDTQNYNASGWVTIQENCFAWAATNLGDTIVEINNNTLFPSATPATVMGDSISKSDPLGGVYKGQMKISFRVPLGAAPLVQISQLYYIDKNKL